MLTNNVLWKPTDNNKIVLIHNKEHVQEDLDLLKQIKQDKLLPLIEKIKAHLEFNICKIMELKRLLIIRPPEKESSALQHMRLRCQKLSWRSGDRSFGVSINVTHQF